MAPISPHSETKTTNSRSQKVVGVFAFVFGLFGTICPVVLVSDPGSPYKQNSGSVNIAPLVIAILAHLLLTIAGGVLLLTREGKLLKWFFVIEGSYILFYALPPPALTFAGLISGDDARWSADVSIGFIVQFIVGFPLWGWIIVRKR